MLVSSYKSYVDEIVTQFHVAGWTERFIKGLIRVLWDDGVTVDRIMVVATRSADYVEVLAMCYDEDDEDTDLICSAKWLYDRSQQSEPKGEVWELDSVELSDEIPGGWR